MHLIFHLRKISSLHFSCGRVSIISYSTVFHQTQNFTFNIVITSRNKHFYTAAAHFIDELFTRNQWCWLSQMARHSTIQLTSQICTKNYDPGQSDYTTKRRKKGQTLPWKLSKFTLGKICVFKEKVILFHNLLAVIYVLNYNAMML